MITIHEKNSTTFDTLGLGALLPSLCTVKEELNGLYELEMEHPYDEWGKWEDIEKERILVASTPRGKQPFRIYHIKPDMNGIQVNARHIFYDLLDNLCLSVSVSGSPQSVLNAIKNAFAFSMPFTFSTNMSGTGSVSASKVNPIAALLSDDEDASSFIKVFGGEILRDSFTVSMKTSIGQDRGVAIRYGKNLVGLEISEDISEVATRIYAYGKDGVAMSGGYRDSPYISSYRYPKIHVFEDSSLTYYELPGAVQALFNEGCDLPKVNIKANFQMLSETEEYKEYAVLEEVQLGDVVTVSNVKMGFHKKAKVISYEWDCLLEQYNEVELGDFVADLTSSVTSGEKSLSTAVSASTEVKQVINLVNGVATITSQGLYICIDTNSIDTATKIYHFGNSGLRFSSTGIKGTYKTILDTNGNRV
ncbi:phage tail spike protein [Anaerotignum propionicum]|uniref:Prophage endopeptidase tail n=2 Tax=Anaerotignum propionicum DSM 1682 TaxID=991789 RepID=A0ABM5YA29_ANAPI|nr:phage tail spike protein [Anaerotignum propionicum]AMJ40706.1 prophage endopeptidase tail [Anaerotignum propionicum DSM 1682]